MSFADYLNYAIGFIVIYTIARSMMPSKIVDLFLILGGIGFFAYYIYNEGIIEKYLYGDNEYEPARKH